MIVHVAVYLKQYYVSANNSISKATVIIDYHQIFSLSVTFFSSFQGVPLLSLLYEQCLLETKSYNFPMLLFLLKTALGPYLRLNLIFSAPVRSRVVFFR